MNYVIIGFSGSGKSTLIQKLIREKKLKVKGYISAKIDSLGEENGNGAPIFIMPIPKRYKAKEGLKEFLEKQINTEQATTDAKCPCTVPAFFEWANKHAGAECIGVSVDGHALADEDALDRFARNVLLPMAKEAKAGDVLVLDEIGVVESKSELFREAISLLLDGPATVVAAVREKHTDFLDSVKNHPQNKCFYVEENNREEVYEELKKCL